MFGGIKVKIENSVWNEANGKTGRVKSIISNDCILIDFDEKEVNRLSSEVGGFTFKEKDLKVIK